MAAARASMQTSAVPVEALSRLSPQGRELVMLIASDAALRGRVKDVLWAELAPELMAYARAEAEKAVSGAIAAKRRGVALGRRSVWDAIKERFPAGTKTSRTLDDPVGEIFGWPEHLSLDLLETPTTLFLLEMRPAITRAHVDTVVRVLDALGARLDAKKRLSLLLVCNSITDDARTALRTASQNKITLRDTLVLEDAQFDIAGAKAGPQ